MENELLQKVKDEVAKEDWAMENWDQLFRVHDMNDLEEAWERSARKYTEAYHAAKIQDRTMHQCFTKEMIADDLGSHITDKELEYFNEKSKAYRMDGMRKALVNAAGSATVSYNPRLLSPYFVNKTSITNSKNLDV